MVKCRRCKSLILPEHEKLSCHAHNDTNLWRPLGTPGLELYELMRTRVIDEEEDHDGTE